MAVDTETKRRSVLGMLITALVIAPLRDGTISAVDREHVNGIYAGIAPGLPVNFPPVADAGADQTVVDATNVGSQEVTLDGSGSTDSDGTIVSFVWVDDLGVTIPSTETPTATFPLGVHTVTLTVTDDDGATDTDTVVVTVNPLWVPETPTSPVWTPVGVGTSIWTPETEASTIWS